MSPYGGMGGGRAVCAAAVGGGDAWGGKGGRRDPRQWGVGASASSTRQAWGTKRGKGGSGPRHSGGRPGLSSRWAHAPPRPTPTAGKRVQRGSRVTLRSPPCAAVLYASSPRGRGRAIQSLSQALSTSGMRAALPRSAPLPGSDSCAEHHPLIPRYVSGLFVVGGRTAAGLARGRCRPCAAASGSGASLCGNARPWRPLGAAERAAQGGSWQRPPHTLPTLLPAPTPAPALLRSSPRVWGRRGYGASVNVVRMN